MAVPITFRFPIGLWIFLILCSIFVASNSSRFEYILFELNMYSLKFGYMENMILCRFWLKKSFIHQLTRNKYSIFINPKFINRNYCWSFFRYLYLCVFCETASSLLSKRPKMKIYHWRYDTLKLVLGFQFEMVTFDLVKNSGFDWIFVSFYVEQNSYLLNLVWEP